MKTKLKRVSRSTLAVILAIMMLFSTMLVGTISVSAADAYYVIGSAVGGWDNSNAKQLTSSDGGNYSITFNSESDFAQSNDFIITSTNSSSNNVKAGIDNSNSTGMTFILVDNGLSGDSNANNIRYTLNSGYTFPVTLTYDSTAKTVSGTATASSTSVNYALTGKLATGNDDSWDIFENGLKFTKTDANGYLYQEVIVSSEINSRFRITDSDRISYVPEKSGTDIKTYTSYSNSCSTYVRDKDGNNKDNYFTFDVSTETTYTVKLDVSGSTPKIWVETQGSDLTKGAITLKDSTPVNGSLSFSAPGKASGTANVGDIVTITAKPFDGFTCTSIAVSYTDTEGTAQASTLTPANNIASFTVPDVKADAKGAKKISFAAAFTLNKENYLSNKGEGLWIDVAPTQNDSTATLIKWNNYSGSNHGTNNPYTFYVPYKTNLAEAKIYNGYNKSVTVNGVTIESKSFNTDTINLSVDSSGYKTFTVAGADSSSLKVMQGSTNAMFLYTTDKNGTAYALATSTSDKRVQDSKYFDNYANEYAYDKESINAKGGSCVTMSDEGKITAAQALEQVKGRGNSSWKASAELFGKYAYNMKLADKTNLFGMAKDTKKGAGSKSWCLLANNMDQSMLRNALTYELADKIGLPNAPEFRFVDIYDNGEYMGAYLVTEKVDVGSSKLINGENIDDIHEAVAENLDETVNENQVVDVDSQKEFTTEGGVTVQYNCATVSSTNVNTYTNAALNGTTIGTDTYKAGTFLLEFEIKKRVRNEASWFKTQKGQYVVVKSPEFATEAEVKYIAEKFVEMETQIYAYADISTLSKYMDVDSFARMYLIQELSSNLDSAATSYYLTYCCADGADARFVASPVWDYDWAYGQHKGSGKKGINSSGNEYDLYSNSTDWFTRYKEIGDNEQQRWNIQAQLANNTNFQSVIKKVWNGTGSDGFYGILQTYYNTNGQLDTWKDSISKSVSMNEARWGFIFDISNNTIKYWGSADATTISNKGTFNGGVDYLKSNWTSTRASWLNEEVNKFNSYTQIAAPTLKAYESDGKTELTGEVQVGSNVVLKTTTPEIFVTYKLYQNDTEVASNEKGIFTVTPDSAGTYTYKVKTVYGESDVRTSNSVSVTATGEAAPALNSVALSAPSTTTVGASITLTANADVTGTATGISYKYYMSNDNTVSEDDTLIKTTETTSCTTYAPSTANTYYYYVVATLGEQTARSELVQVVVKGEVGSHDVTFHFKSSSAYPYKPTATIDGTPHAMTREDPCLGTIYTGVLSIYWYSVTVNIDSKDTHTLKFTTASTSMNAEKTDKFSGDEYYFAVDNLVNGTEIVDLTNKDEYIRNYFHTPTHMVDSTDYSDGSLGFTYAKGDDGVYRTYRMCTYVDNGSTYSIDSVTAIQKSCAGLLSTSSIQTCLFDANLDGEVDINDATLLQKALAQ